MYGSVPVVFDWLVLAVVVVDFLAVDVSGVDPESPFDVPVPEFVVSVPVVSVLVSAATTVTSIGPDVDTLFDESPENTAVITLSPAVNESVVRVASPSSTGAVPKLVGVVEKAALRFEPVVVSVAAVALKNSTMPVGLSPIIVAVKVTSSPSDSEVFDAAISIEVLVRTATSDGLDVEPTLDESPENSAVIACVPSVNEST